MLYFLKEVIKAGVEEVGDSGSQRLPKNKKLGVQFKEQVDVKVLLRFNNFRKYIGVILL